LVIGTNSLQELVTGAWLWDWNVVLVAESLELRFSPAGFSQYEVKRGRSYSRIEDPFSDVAIRVVDGVLGILPSALELGNKGVLILLGALLDRCSGRHQILVNLIRIPAVVWGDDFVIPVVFDQVLQVFPVSWSWVRNVVV
jgi:hypothetical protein